MAGSVSAVTLLRLLLRHRSLSPPRCGCRVASRYRLQQADQRASRVWYFDGAEHHWGRPIGQIHLIVALVVLVLLPVAVALVAVALVAVALVALYLLVSREYDVLPCLAVQASEGVAAVVGGEDSHRLIGAA